MNIEYLPVSSEQLMSRIGVSQTKLTPHAARLWELARIAPQKWKIGQYPKLETCWVVAVIGQQCLYLNEVEDGFCWGQFQTWGEVDSHGWEQDEVHGAMNRLMFAIESA